MSRNLKVFLQGMLIVGAVVTLAWLAARSQEHKQQLAFPDPKEYQGYGPPSAERDQRIIRDAQMAEEAARQASGS